MDELETRIAALEVLKLEELAWRSRQYLEDLAEGLRLSLNRVVDVSERAARTQALAIVEDALERHPG